MTSASPSPLSPLPAPQDPAAASGLSPLAIQLTSMQLPEAMPHHLARATGLSAGVAVDVVLSSRQLLLRPADPSEMVITLANRGDRAIAFWVQVMGDFPPHWCQWERDRHILQPDHITQATLSFRIPADFFEDSQTLRSGESLQLDYRCRVYIQSYAADDAHSGTPQIEVADFSLHARPASLYLDFIPQLYRESDLLSRFLALVEQAFEPTVETLDTLWAYLDPLTAPRAMLPFLAHWVGWELEPRWSLDQQRRLIRHAMTLYRWRGTRRGLRLYLHLYTGLPLDEHIEPEADKHISILELSSSGLTVGETPIGEATRLGGGQPFHFIVILRPSRPHTIDEALIRQVIEREKPAFCTYELLIHPRDSGTTPVPAPVADAAITAALDP